MVKLGMFKAGEGDFIRKGGGNKYAIDNMAVYSTILWQGYSPLLLLLFRFSEYYDSAMKDEMERWTKDAAEKMQIPLDKLWSKREGW